MDALFHTKFANYHCWFDASRGVYSDTTQLNWTDPVEQRTANQREASQSCFRLWRHKQAFDLSWVQLSCVAINTSLALIMQTGYEVSSLSVPVVIDYMFKE